MCPNMVSQNIDFEKLYDNNEDEFEFHGGFYEHQDTIYFLSTARIDNSFGNLVLRKIDIESGSELTKKIYLNEIGVSLSIDDIFIRNNHLFFCGIHQKESGPDNYDILVGKMDFNGTVKWLKEFGEKKRYERARAIHVDAQENIFVAAAQRKVDTVNQEHGLCLKINGKGQLLWNKVLSFQNNEFTPYGIVADENENIYISGDVHKLIPSVKDLGFVKIDSEGELIYSNQYSFGNLAFNHDLLMDSKQLILTASINYVNTDNKTVPSILVFDKDGAVRKEKNFYNEIGSKAGFAGRIIPTNGGGYAMFYETNDSPNIIILDSDLSLHKTIAALETFEGSYSTNQVFQLKDNSFLVGGSIYPNQLNEELKTLWLAKSSNNLDLVVSLDNNLPEMLEVFPNPSNGIIFFKKQKRISYFELFSLEGVCLTKGLLSSNLLDIGFLNSGSYLLMLYDESKNRIGYSEIIIFQK